MAVSELLRALLSAPGPSGYESAPAAVWREAASGFAEVKGDAMGSSVARVPGAGGGPVLAVLGHIDEIGLIVTHIDENGFLYFRGVGGWRGEVLRGQRVELVTRDGRIPGVVGKKARPERRREEEEKPTDINELHIDIGARDRDEASAMVRVGDVAVIAGEPVELPNRRLVSRALDNRLGAYVALEAARLLAEGERPAGDFLAVAAVQEEVGDFAGARTSAFRLDPDVALAVDVTDTTDVPGGDPKVAGEAKLGAGPVLNRGSTINPAVFELLVEAAEAEGIPFSVNVSTGTTSTDMDALHVSRAGVATGLVSLATRYIHSPTELVSLDDVDAAVRLVAAFARRLGPGTDFGR